jgi:hypothetical protein
MTRGLDGRLTRLEQVCSAGGRCPGCGFRPGDVRLIVFGTSGEPERPIDVPGRPLCVVCGGPMPPITIIETWRE